MILKKITQEIISRYPDAILQEKGQGNELYLDITVDSLKGVAQFIHSKYHALLVNLFATDERTTSDSFKLYYLFAVYKESCFIFLRITIAADKPEFPSLAKDMFAANLFEREIRDMFGITPLNHPDARPLVLHENYPADVHPLRKDFAWNTQLPFLEGQPPHPFYKTEGEGVFEVPVGPVHAGIIEPGHFRFTVAGEPIIHQEIQLHYKHKGIEKLMETVSLEKGAELAERVSGDSTIAHAIAYCHAVEKALKWEVPELAQWNRMLLLELERIYNHISDIGGLATDVGFSFGATQAQILRESVLQLNEQLTGSRFLRGQVIPGRVARDIVNTNAAMIKLLMDTMLPEFHAIVEVLLTTRTFMDRVTSTGVLEKQIAHDLSISGVMARASGINRDMRRDFPHEQYRAVKMNIPVHQKGDVLCRLRVRVEEVEQSVAIIRQILEHPRTGEIRIPNQPLEGGRYALGYTEGWRGAIYYWIQIGLDHQIQRCKIRDASFCNWTGMPFAVPGNIIPDFPLINKSFNLSYSGNDL